MEVFRLHLRNCNFYENFLFRLVDSRDGTKYTVQVAHSASLLLSMILVYGWQQRLLCMAHLIGADTLPSKDQLDTNLVSFVLIFQFF